MMSIIRSQMKVCRNCFQRIIFNNLQPSHFTTCVKNKPTQNIVLVSTSTNIFDNLALEDWLYENESFINKNILLIWRNTPSVVIGRHQNPWHECNMQKLMRDGICLARRNSGGGAVYHDEGNLNFSFHCSRNLYNRCKNLQLVIDAVQSIVDINLRINDRDDIILDDIYKVSGSASKLAHDRSYHHFTLLVNVDTEKLTEYLVPDWGGLSSRATPSIPASVSSLSQVDYTGLLSFSTLVEIVAKLYISSNSQINEEIQVQYVHPDEKSFYGISKNKAKFQSWEWIFSKTPKFTITRTFKLNTKYDDVSFTITVTIEKAYIVDIEIHSALENTSVLTEFLKEGFRECRMTVEDIKERLNLIRNRSDFEWIVSDSLTRKTILLFFLQILIL